jgi:predicted esterase
MMKSPNRSWMSLTVFMGLCFVAGGFVSGESVTVPGLAKPIVVQLPDNYDPAETWPVLYFWPGPSGAPTTRTVSPACGKKDWIIVGMAYTQKELLQVSSERIAAEVAAFERARPIVEGEYAVDRRRVYVGGYFTGGWVAAELLSDDPSLAGALMLGSGFLDQQSLPVQQSVGGKPVYVGVGSLYTNHLMGVRAVRRFRGAGAKATWDAWDFLGKAVPQDFDDYPALRQWMRLQSGKENGAELREQAKTWGQERLKAIDEMSDAGERYVALQRFREMPFLRVFGEGAVAAVDRKIVAVGKEAPDGVREAALWRRYEELLQMELRDRSRASLERCLVEYDAILAEGEGTSTGRLAGAERERIAKVLGQ